MKERALRNAENWEAGVKAILALRRKHGDGTARG